jgi:hypothetical protein
MTGIWSYRSPRSAHWITPARYLKNENADQFLVTFNPGEMNSAGIIYFKDISMPTYMMSFVASRVYVERVTGPTTLFFDFVGTYGQSLLYSNFLVKMQII